MGSCQRCWLQLTLCQCAGIIFTVCCEPYLDSEYGDAFINDSPVRLMDLTLHGHREFIEQEVCLSALILLLGHVSLHTSLAVWSHTRHPLFVPMRSRRQAGTDLQPAAQGRRDGCCQVTSQK